MGSVHWGFGFRIFEPLFKKSKNYVKLQEF
jgi:hypothetical protein